MLRNRSRITPEHEIFLVLFLVIGACAWLNAVASRPKLPPTFPPIFSITDKDPKKEGAPFFKSGFAEITSDGIQRLMFYVAQVEMASADGFDAVEIIGHADTRMMQRPQVRPAPLYYEFSRSWTIPADFDYLLAAWARGLEEAVLVPGDPHGSVKIPNDLAQNAVSNVNLGMMRALAVVRFFEEQRKTPRASGQGFLLDRIRSFTAMSAGAFVRPDNTLDLGPQDEEDGERRRIEIRVYSLAQRQVAEQPR